MANKVKFNIHDVHYAVKTSSGYGTPVALPGAVSISLEPQGDSNAFYADGIKYYITNTNTGYQGDLTVALIPDSFRKQILGEIEDSKNVMFEKHSVEPVHFALGFTIDGNDKAVKFWFYDCTATRPTTAGETTTESKEPQTDTINITAIPTTDGYVRAKTSAETDATVYAGWYEDVVEYTAGS